MGLLDRILQPDSENETTEDLSEYLVGHLDEMINSFIEQIKEWLDAEPGNLTDSNSQTEETLATQQILANLTFEEIPDSVHNLKQRQLGMLTSGMFGWEGSGDGEFDLTDPSVNQHIRSLVEEYNVQNIVTLCGGDADDGIRAKLNELGFSNVNTLSFRIHTVENLEQARAAYDQDLIHDLGTCYNMVQSGHTCIHCQNGAHRSLTVSLIMFMLANPDYTYQQALDANMSESEATNSHFNAYSKLAQVLENNPDLRAQILNV